MKKALVALLFCVSLLRGQGLSASGFTWAQLTDNSTAGTVTGNIGSVGVTFTSTDLRFSQVNNTGTNWWLCGVVMCPVYNTVGIPAPTRTDMIAIDGTAVTHTITFSAPVLNPMLALISLGEPSVFTTYYFDHAPTILTDGPGWWGGPGTLLAVAVNGVQGIEGDGLVQFQGTYSKISWTGVSPENWNGFNVGASATPEPGSLALLGTGVLGLAGVLRRKLS